jgi:predicted DNA-binding transcriptional regulator AlpA
LLDTRQVADLLGMSVAWVEIARHKGSGPAYVRVTPRCVRYRRSDVKAWLNERCHCWTGEYTQSDPR